MHHCNPNGSSLPPTHQALGVLPVSQPLLNASRLCASVFLWDSLARAHNPNESLPLQDVLHTPVLIRPIHPHLRDYLQGELGHLDDSAHKLLTPSTGE
jgi:hypothetical protein